MMMMMMMMMMADEGENSVLSKRSMKRCIELTAPGQTLVMAKIKRNIFQGDSLSSLLFMDDLNSFAQN